jgi:hypothetical protein
MSPDGAGLSEGDATKVARALPGKISGHQGTAGTREGAAESLLRAYQKASVRPQLPEQE